MLLDRRMMILWRDDYGTHDNTQSPNATDRMRAGTSKARGTPSSRTRAVTITSDVRHKT